MPTSILKYHYPLSCFTKQAELKLTELAVARLTDDCKEDREYAKLLTQFLAAINRPYLPYSIVKLRSYSQYLANLGDFLYCPDEEVDENGDPPASISDTYQLTYRDRY